jgi:peptidoglycan LD-endopeptidase CwlK
LSSTPVASGRLPYKNQIPWDIIHIFESHGFIWGGKWYHYDTMHFEYRPEQLIAGKAP